MIRSIISTILNAISAFWYGLKKREQKIILSGFGLVLITAIFLVFSNARQSLVSLKQETNSLKEDISWMQRQAETLASLSNNCQNSEYQVQFDTATFDQLARSNRLTISHQSDERNGKYSIGVSSNDGSRILRFIHQVSCSGLPLSSVSIDLPQDEGGVVEGEITFSSSMLSSVSSKHLALVLNKTPNWNWFNRRANSAVTVDAPERLEESSLNAELLGVVVSGNLASATIKFNNQPESVFHIGDELSRGVEIKAISASRVVIEERGNLTQLSLKKYDALLQIVSSNVTANTRNNNDSGFALANMFAATPVQVDNFDTGLRLDSLSTEIKMLADIRDGDVVVQIGSNDIQELMSDSSLWANYSAQTAIPVTVIRNGEEVVLTVNLFSLSAKILPSLASELIP